MADMGTFTVIIEIENLAAEGEARTVGPMYVDTGSELTWVARHMLESLGIEPRRVQEFSVADGKTVARHTGFALVRVEGRETADDVVFAEEGDLQLLGARSLEGLNLRVDAREKKLVAAGPMLAATGR